MRQAIDIIISCDGEEVAIIEGDSFLSHINRHIKREGGTDYPDLESFVEKAKCGLPETLRDIPLIEFGHCTLSDVISWEVIDVPDDYEFVTCDETDLVIAKEFAAKRELWDRPFDSKPRTAWFLNDRAEQCYLGDYYSKDFAWFTCEACGRTICEQNPSNGWHVQYRVEGGYRICNKCVEEHLFEHGINEERFREEGKIHHWLFMEDDELREKGWVPQDTINIRYEDELKERILHYFNSNKKVILSMFTMAITGSEGIATIWAKDKTEGI